MILGIPYGGWALIAAGIAMLVLFLGFIKWGAHGSGDEE